MKTTDNPYETKTILAVLEEFTVQVAAGIPAAEIPVRQKTYGLNEVPDDQPSLLLVFAKHFWGLTAFMLEFTIIVSFFLHKYVDVYLISGLMLFNAIIGFAQELKAAKTVKALKSSLQVMVRVLRGGQWGTVTGNQLVPGDIITELCYSRFYAVVRRIFFNIECRRPFPEMHPFQQSRRRFNS